MNTIMAKLVTVVLLTFVTIIQFHSVFGFDNATDADPIEEGRLLISGIIRNKCTAKLNAKSSVAPNVGVTLTRLANGRLYFFSPTALNTRLTFENARIFCQEHGMHLVTINSVEENFLVFNKAVDLGIAVGANGAWIGYRDVTGTGIYQWVQPKVGSTPTFFLGANTPPPAGMCAAYSDIAAAVATSWISPLCTTLRSFICEMEPPCSLVL